MFYVPILRLSVIGSSAGSHGRWCKIWVKRINLPGWLQLWKQQTIYGDSNFDETVAQYTKSI